MITRRQSLALACALMASGCTDDPPSGTRLEPARSLVLDRAPRPSDRELRLRVGMDPSTERVDRAVARRDGEQIGVEVWVVVRVPGGEPASDAGRTVVETIPLDMQVGSAVVVDLLANPPAQIPVAP